jgi:hypothetical protein
MLSSKKVLTILILSLILLLFLPTFVNAAVFDLPEKSPCFKNEVFLSRFGDEPIAPFVTFVEPKPQLNQVVKCRNTTHYFVVGSCEKIVPQVNALKEDPAGYCLQIDDYCLLTGCNPEDKKTEISNFSFYTNGPFFNRERSIMSPVLKKIFGFFGEIELLFKPLAPITKNVEKLTGINSFLLMTIGVNFLLNLFFISIILLAFKKFALQEALSHEWKYIGEVFLVTILAFVIDLKTKNIVPNILTSYIINFVISTLLSYIIVYRTLLRKFQIPASTLFGVLSNPFWLWLLNFFIKRVVLTSL